MKRPFKLLRGPGDGISALLINKLGHVALILLCHSAVRRNERPSFVFSSQSTNTSPFFFFFFFFSSLQLWFLSSWRSRRAIYLRCHRHQNRLQNLRRNLRQDQQQNPWWNLIRYFFCLFRFLVRVSACFRMLVFCRRPSYHSFFFGVSVSLVFLPVFAGFVIWVVFTCHVSLGYACLSPFVPLFLVFSLVLSLQVLRTFLCS